MKYAVMVWTGFIWLRTGSSDGSCGHGNESSDKIKGGEFLCYLRDISFLKENSAQEDQFG
jgi:hypothetical protein